MTKLKKIACACLCHRMLYGAIASTYAAGWWHVLEHGVVMAIAALVYAVMAARG